MNFPFTKYLKHEGSPQVVCLEQIILKKSVDSEDFVITFLLYSLIYIYIVNVILIYTSNVFLSITYIKQVKSFTVNYPADVPPKYIFYLMELLLSLTPSKHIKCISRIK
jgi:hypothetical protein